jgi:ankyrin repeat protein
MAGKGKRGRVKKTKPTIYHAAREGLVADLDLFLQQGSDVNEPDNVCLVSNLVSFALTWRFPLTYWSPLHYSCLFGRKDAVKFLLEHGADVNRLTEGVFFLFRLSLFSLSCPFSIHIEVLFPHSAFLFAFWSLFNFFWELDRRK